VISSEEICRSKVFESGGKGDDWPSLGSGEPTEGNFIGTMRGAFPGVRACGLLERGFETKGGSDFFSEVIKMRTPSWPTRNHVQDKTEF
jgi:hypothetical protein